MTIHTIGDSHCINGWNNIIKHHLGPVLCYSFGREKLNRCNIRKLKNINNGDTVIFCFGEIDCRCHINKYVNYKSVIESIVNNYFESININIITSKINFKNVCVYNVIPSIQKEYAHDFPCLGTDNERKEYVLYFNEKIKEKCKIYSYVFFDIYEKYTDINGFLRKDLSDGNVHIRNGTYINEFILNNLI